MVANAGADLDYRVSPAKTSRYRLLDMRLPPSVTKNARSEVEVGWRQVDDLSPMGESKHAVAE
jgi:hypothetical protein